MEQIHHLAVQVVSEVCKAVVGKRDVVEKTLLAILAPGACAAGGHPRRGENYHGPGLFPRPWTCGTTGSSLRRT